METPDRYLSEQFFQSLGGKRHGSKKGTCRGYWYYLQEDGQYLRGGRDISYCIENPDESGEHEADPRSASQADDSDFIIDYFCKYCGQSASIKINPLDLQWE